MLSLALGVAMSAIVGPLLLAVAAGTLKLAAALGCTEVCGRGTRAIGLFAREGASVAHRHRRSWQHSRDA